MIGIKEYCSQNDGDCETCVLVNYGKDCMNQPVEGLYKTIKGEYCRKYDTQLMKAGNTMKEIGFCPICHGEYVLWKAE